MLICNTPKAKLKQNNGSQKPRESYPMNNAQVNRKVESLCSDHEFLIRLRNNKFKMFDFSVEMIDVASATEYSEHRENFEFSVDRPIGGRHS